jgi:hypothetical protein
LVLEQFSSCQSPNSKIIVKSVLERVGASFEARVTVSHHEKGHFFSMSRKCAIAVESASKKSVILCAGKLVSLNRKDFSIPVKDLVNDTKSNEYKTSEKGLEIPAVYLRELLNSVPLSMIVTCYNVLEKAVETNLSETLRNNSLQCENQFNLLLSSISVSSSLSLSATVQPAGIDNKSISIPTVGGEMLKKYHPSLLNKAVELMAFEGVPIQVAKTFCDVIERSLQKVAMLIHYQQDIGQGNEGNYHSCDVIMIVLL